MSDPISEMMSLLGGDSDKIQLAVQAERQLDIALKYLQMLWYTTQLEGEEAADKLARRVKPLIELVIENMEQTVKEYQDKHGEI